MRHWHKPDKGIRTDPSTYVTKVYDRQHHKAAGKEEWGSKHTISLPTLYRCVVSYGAGLFHQGPGDIDVVISHLSL